MLEGDSGFSMATENTLKAETHITARVQKDFDLLRLLDSEPN